MTRTFVARGLGRLLYARPAGLLLRGLSLNKQPASALAPGPPQSQAQWAQSADGTAHDADSPRTQLFQALRLTRFTEEELAASFDRVYGKEGEEEARQRLQKLLKDNNLSTKLLSPQTYVPSKEEWKAEITQLGEKLDPRVWPLGLSFLGTGLSIGIIVPILPLLVETLHIPPTQFGFIVSAFGLAKLAGNIPSAQWVERYGRKKIMINGMLLCSLGIGSVGLAVDPSFGAPSLLVSRLITGFGVSCFTSAAFMMLSDISTALNRTRTMSPVMASFQAGTALGPAIGGVAVSHLGIASSYYVVGGMIGGLAGLNYLFLKESARAQELLLSSSSTPPSSSLFNIAITKWRELLKVPRMQNVVLVNLMYWIGLSGTSLTLLPLYMVDLHLEPAQIGLCFAFSSSVSVAASQPVAYLADKWGKEKIITTALCLLGSSMVALPLTATSFESLLAVLAPMALGSTALSAVPTALTGDIVEGPQRSQALALLRTAGDVGLLVGAIASGLAASLGSIGTTMEVNGALLLGSAAVWVMRRRSF